MRFKQIKETCIYCSNLDRAKDFYHGLLGLPVIGELKDKHVFFKAGSSVLLCFNPDDSKLKTSPPAHFATGPYHFAFEVSLDEYDHHKQEVVKKGVQIIDTLKWKQNLESFYFNDPAGNVVEIIPEGVWD